MNGVDIRTLFLFCMVCCASGTPIFPEETPIFAVPTDSRKEWTVGIAPFKNNGLSPENSYLIYNLPLLLYENIARIKTHTFRNDEIAAYKERIKNDAILDAEKALGSLIEERDALMFEGLAPYYKEKKQADLAGKIDAAKKRISFFSTLALDSIAYPKEKPISFKKGKASAILDSFSTSAFEGNRLGLDLLVWGGVEEIGEYFFVEIHAYHPIEKKDVFSYKDAASKETLEDVIHEASKELVSLVLGTEWASLSIEVVPAEANIFLDEEFIGKGTVSLPFLEPGEHRLHVFLPGRRPLTETITLSAFEDKRIERTLAESTVAPLTIGTDPPEADIYLDSLWVGKSPLSVQRPASQQRGLIKKEGYKLFPFILMPDTETLSVTLTKDIINTNELVKELKNEFYASLGGFFVSIAVPLVLFGFYQNSYIGYKKAVELNRYDDIQRLYDQGTIFYYSYLGGIFVSVSLFVNTAVKLFDYIRTADTTLR